MCVFVAFASFSGLALAQESRNPAAESLGAGFGVFVLIALLITFAVINAAIFAGIAYMIILNYKAIPEEHHKMEVKKVWLLAIPLFNLYWCFPTFQGLSDSYKSYFDSVGDTSVGDCGRQKALIAAICYAAGTVLGFVPIINCLGALSGLAGLVFLILFLVQVFDLKKKIGTAVA